MYIVSLSRSINRNLIRLFDQSRISYVFLVFPVYQLLAIIGGNGIVSAFELVGTSFYFLPIGLILAFFIGVPIFASWHLSVILFGICYFGFFARLGFPFLPWAIGQLESAVDWYRPAK